MSWFRKTVTVVNCHDKTGNLSNKDPLKKFNARLRYLRIYRAYNQCYQISPMADIHCGFWACRSGKCRPILRVFQPYSAITAQWYHIHQKTPQRSNPSQIGNVGCQKFATTIHHGRYLTTITTP